MLLAIITSSVIIVVLVMVAGATQSTPFMEGTLTSTANATMWNSAATVFNAGFAIEIIVPVLVIAGLLLLFLLYLMSRCALAGGMG